jgi:hypothetical protein
VRRLVVSLVSAVLLLIPAWSTVSAAAPPVSITISSATLVARGAAVDVSFDVVCDPVLGNDGETYTDLLLDGMGSWVTIDQAVSKKVIAHSSADMPQGTPISCDGTTVNSFAARVTADSVPFRQGPAIVGAQVYMYTEAWVVYGYSGSASTVLKISKQTH